MKSLFGEHKQKVIPSSLQDCTKMDGVSKSLWQWAKNLENTAICLFLLDIVAGVIVGIEVAADNEEFGLFFAGFFGGIAAGFLAYYLFLVAALLVGSLASIVENTRISADVALFESARAGGDTVCIQTAQQPTQQEAQQPPRAVGLLPPQEGACENCNATDETLYGVMMKDGKSCQVCSKCYDYFEEKGLLK